MIAKTILWVTTEAGKVLYRFEGEMNINEAVVGTYIPYPDGDALITDTTLYGYNPDSPYYNNGRVYMRVKAVIGESD